MRAIIHDVRVLMARELGAFQREIERFPDDVLLWKTPPGIANSAGNLALHVCGNLQHFVGGVLGETGYVRNRDLEFSRRSGTRAEVVAQLRQTAAVVESTLSRLTEPAFAAEYPEVKRSLRFPTHAFLLHLHAHLAFHLGQAGYVRRCLTADTASSQPMSIDELSAALERK